MKELLDAREVLLARARALAQVPPPPPASHMLEILEFRLAQERYAIETRYVTEVQPLRDLAPLPGTPAFVLGVVNVRGRILPVFDLKKFFDLPQTGITDLHRIVLVRMKDVELGLLADVVVGVSNVVAEDMQTAVATLTDGRAHYLKGIVDGDLVVLHLAQLLSDPRILVHDDAET